MVKQKEKLNIMVDDISDEGVDFHSIEPVEDLDDDEDIRTGLVIKLEYNGIVADEAILVLRGDVDGDGVVNLVDYMAVINHYVESAEITEYPFFLAADVDEDETINMADAMKILNYYTENIDTLND